MALVCFFFFFQAEDGIRDGHVTGVQTCALPILNHPWFSPCGFCAVPVLPATAISPRLAYHRPLPVVTTPRIPLRTTSRSEERRVGKEGRARRSREPEEERRREEQREGEIAKDRM